MTNVPNHSIAALQTWIAQAARLPKSGRYARPKRVVTHKEQNGLICFTTPDNCLCMDWATPVRVVLTADLRHTYNNLHVGMLGWTIPPLTDYYRHAAIHFDAGHVALVHLKAIQPVIPELADDIAQTVLRNVAGTPFDSDTAVAAIALEAHRRNQWGGTIHWTNAAQSGRGPESLYAFTYPSQNNGSTAPTTAPHPIKIGYTRDWWQMGALTLDATLHRIARQPSPHNEPTIVLGVWRHTDAHKLETLVHRSLKKGGQKVETQLGNEWYSTTIGQVDQLVHQLSPAHRICPLEGPYLPVICGARPIYHKYWLS